MIGDGELIEFGHPELLLQNKNGHFCRLVDADTQNKRKGAKDSTQSVKDPVDDLSQQLPQQTCADSPLQTKDQRHLKKLHEAEGGALARQAEEACSGLLGDDLFDACVFDVLVTGDVSFVEQYNDW